MTATGLEPTICKRTLNHLAKLTKWLSCVVSTYLYSAFNCMLFSCHVRLSEWIHTLYLLECQGTSCSKQARYLKFNWPQRDSNPQQLNWQTKAKMDEWNQSNSCFLYYPGRFIPWLSTYFLEVCASISTKVTTSSSFRGKQISKIHIFEAIILKTNEAAWPM